MDIDKINNNTPEKPFHSSSYAEVANGGSIGSTNSQTFGERYTTDRNRSVVRKYRDSHIGRGSLRHQARTGIVVDTFGRIDPAASASLQAQNAAAPDPLAPTPINHSRVTPPPASRASFKEPPTRGFNPYS